MSLLCNTYKYSASLVKNTAWGASKKSENECILLYKPYEARRVDSKEKEDPTMSKHTMEMILEYAKIFPQNADMGSPTGSKAAKAVHAKGGQYIVNAYFTSEDQIEELLKAGLDPTPMNSQRILEGNADFGIGKFIKLKRDVMDVIKTFENKGEETTVNYGGPVGVVNLTNGPENKTWWSLEDDGLIGNGTRAMVQFEMYANGAGLRLKNVGITEHVPYEGNRANNENDELFKVA